MRAVALAALVVLGVVAAPARAQLQEFCRLTDVRVQKLTNGVRIRLIADGVLKVGFDFESLLYQDNPTERYKRRVTQRFPLYLGNVRGAPAPTIAVNTYPVSHIEFSVPPGAREGIGLVCTVVFYKPGTIGDFYTEPNDKQRGLDQEQDWIVPPTPLRLDFEVSHSFSELLLFAHSDRPSEPEVEDKRKITAPPSLQVFASDGRVYVSAVNADLQELLRQVSEVAGVRIVCADEVERRASANLPGLPVGELLRDLARAYGLALAERDGAYYVSGGGLDTAPGYWACEVREVPLHHITPESALYSLPDVLLGYVQVSPASNSLVVAGPKAMVDKVEGDLKVLDQPVWFTRLRGWVVEASGDEEDSRDLDLALAGGTTVAAASSWGHLALEVAGARPREVLARLDALQSRDVVKVRSCPSVAVANGQWGELFVGENQRFWQLAGYIQQMITAQVSAGVRIRCRPRTSGGSITMDLTLDSDSFVGFALPPRVQRRSVSSTLRVTDGDTILVGGLRSVEMQRERRTPRPGVTLPLFTAVATGMAKVKTFQDLWVLLEARARRGSVPTEAGGAGIGKISAS